MPLTKQRIAQIRESRRHGNLYLPGEDIDAMLDAVETLTKALQACQADYVPEIRYRQEIATAALAKVYGEDKC